MSSGIDKEFVRAYYARMTDKEIVRVLTNDLKGLTADAQEIVREEITKRGLDPAIANSIAAQQLTYMPPEKVFNPNSCPIEEPERIWMEQSFLILLNFFGEPETLSRIVLTPERKHFRVKYDGSERSALETLAIVAKQMEVDPAEVELDFYDDHLSEITEGSPGGLYGGRGENNKFEISLVRRKLDDPEGMVATLAHEIAHIKLLGENRIEENDEKLTDMTTIFFGLGVFNANASFKTWADSKYYGWSTAGYLTQMEWGYALALFAYVRQEPKPTWLEHLSKNVKADFLQGWNFMVTNEDKIFQS